MSRFDKIAAKLKEYEVDAMLVLSESGRLYATGFHSTAGAALITEKESFFFTDSRYIEAAARTITGGTVAESTREKGIYQHINEQIERLGIKCIGIEERYISVAEYEALKAKIRCELKGATALLDALRVSKDAWEIEQMTRAQRIAEKALEEVFDFIRVGRTEKEIAAFLQYKMLLGGAEKMSFDPIVVSGANSSMPHGVPTDKKVEEGDFLTMDFGCIYNGYCSDMTRTVAVGSVSDEMSKVYETVFKAQQAGIDLAKAGVKGEDVHNAAAKVISDAGYGAYFGHGYGHSLGVEIHEDPRFAPGHTDPIPLNAVLSAEPGIYLPGKFGVRIEDVIVLKEDGCENITLAPKNLIIL